KFFADAKLPRSEYLISELQVANPANLELLILHQVRRRDGDTSYYYTETVKKKRVFLHYTVGYLPGDVRTLTMPRNKVSVAFVVARSGKIVQLFPSYLWSYHLGAPAIGENPHMSSTSIAIEISNIGPLIKKGNALFTIYKNKVGEYTDEYCKISEKSAYTYLDSGYRGYQYFATFTQAQYEATAQLVRFLTAKYDIPLNFLSENKRYDVLSFSEARGFAGVLSHVNVRTDKNDIGPAFDWTGLIASCKKFDDS
ncbi:MAG: hypothetical protein RLZZ156_2188, partial [Deinococcota bacterium]